MFGGTPPGLLHGGGGMLLNIGGGIPGRPLAICGGGIKGRGAIAVSKMLNPGRISSIYV